MSNSEYSDRILNEIDWNFSSFGNDGLNSFHWYPATFISAIPGSLIPLLSKPNDTVLDTFCGTSVTGIEAIRLGRNFIGIDNNPIAVLISKAKLCFPNTINLLKLFNGLSENTFKLRNGSKHPNQDILLKWYHETTFNELNNILNFISEIRDPNQKLVSQALFSSIAKKTCAQGKHWGWVCDNVQPATNEIIYKNAYEIFYKALLAYTESVKQVLDDINYRLSIHNIEIIRERSKIICNDTLQALDGFENDHVDLILTSPPYYGVADYVKAQRLSFLWFHEELIKVENYGYNDFEALRKKETGARSNRHRKSSFAEYISYMKSFLDLSSRVLKSGGYFVLIIGDSRSREQTIEELNLYFENIGFIKEYSFERQIKETKRRLMAKVKNEQILVFKKS